MFEKLYAVSKPQALGASHYAPRCIKHKRNLQNVDPNLPPWTDTEPSIGEKRIAVQLLEEIEHLEQTPIHLLSQEKADEYIIRMSQIVFNRYFKGMTQEHRNQGKRLLEELRKNPIVWNDPMPGEKISPPSENQGQILQAHGEATTSK